ncbi:hypothetical protein [Ancylobacter sp.]|uniref:hypothetical protein n=1 Tax=Ancylobacter sp. TaxID=1872567 RepID=UPI003D14B77A
MNAPEVCHFQPGQLVECIDDEWVNIIGERPRVPTPVSGCVYTIAEAHEYLGGIFLGFEPYGTGIWFSWLHFRPVQTPDIGIFRGLLAPSPASPREVELA